MAGCSPSFWFPQKRLCDAVADLIRLLANSIIDFPLIQALMANCLIALDKSPGVRSIGIGETLHRVIGKTVCLLCWEDWNKSVRSVSYVPFKVWD